MKRKGGQNVTIGGKVVGKTTKGKDLEFCHSSSRRVCLDNKLALRKFYEQ